MKDVLYVIYLDKVENASTRSYDIATLDVGRISDFELVEKYPDRLIVRFGHHGESSAEVCKNGDWVALFRRDVEYDNDGSNYPVIETMGFCWKVED